VMAAVVAGGLIAVLPIRADREVPAQLPTPVTSQADHGKIQYVKVAIENTTTVRGKVKPEGGTIEEWHRGTETHRISRYASGETLEHIISAAGEMRQIDSQGGYRIIQPADGADGRHVIADEQRGLVADFLRFYREGKPDDSDFTFAGHPAKRSVYQQVIKTRDQNGNLLASDLGPRRYYYVDAKTGAPLGTSSTDDRGQDAKGDRLLMTFMQTFLTIRELPPTAANVAKLRRFILQRKRDKAPVQP
jgi:hypothetical protein